MKGGREGKRGKGGGRKRGREGGGGKREEGKWREGGRGREGKGEGGGREREREGGGKEREGGGRVPYYSHCTNVPKMCREQGKRGFYYGDLHKRKRYFMSTMNVLKYCNSCFMNATPMCKYCPSRCYIAHTMKMKEAHILSSLSNIETVIVHVSLIPRPSVWYWESC